VAEYFEQSGKYTVCWCGPVGSRVYVAWWQDEALGYLKTGTDQQRLEAARLLCRDHARQQAAVAKKRGK